MKTKKSGDPPERNFTITLLSWYHKNQRDLPWRRTRNPYHIWISEIILQQTRIDQGLDYYHRFLERFPTIASLAAADENEVLKQWQGLGYYSRARNLHHAAREIVKIHHGVFPDTYDYIRKLKGVGDYTAAAIASIVYRLPYPVVDGNVLRFFSRHFGITDPIDKAPGKKRILDLAREMMGPADPGQFNQAIMEFGALQCRAGTPDCKTCPFLKTCFAYNHGQIADLPAKSKSAAAKNRYFNYLVMITTDKAGQNKVGLRRREGDDIWRNLYDFQLIESSAPLTQQKLMQSEEWKTLVADKNAILLHKSKVYKHILTHQLIHARFYIIGIKKKSVKGLVMVNVKEMGDYPLPRLIDKFLLGEELKKFTQ